ncbi:2OG-Fe(II) oxygenase [Actinomadura terrae]|uniref:2OG-Fe(II) oxygenase n=1 Tax=Actinomadura terrae TaxID=604353 RepID=UPI001FA75EB9|nr:2OG-Fe(II) oxygenase [Actinomadura terrae]
MTFVEKIRDTSVDEAKADDISDVVHGSLGALRMEDFFSHADCRSFVSALSPTMFEQYDPDYYQTEAFRIGPSLTEHRSSIEEYPPAAEKAWQTWHDGAFPVDLHSIFRSKVQRIWNGRLRGASCRGKPAFWGMIRRMAAGTLVHWDDIREEFPGYVLDEALSDQISVNVFLEGPAEGGELLVWSRARHSSDEAARISYGYDRARVVPEPPDVTLLPRTGDAVMFSPLKYHLVEPVTKGDRLVFSVFMAIAEDGDLVVWA